MITSNEYYKKRTTTATITQDCWEHTPSGDDHSSDRISDLEEGTQLYVNKLWPCSRCRGQTFVRWSFLSILRACKVCHGRGKVYERTYVGVVTKVKVGKWEKS